MLHDGSIDGDMAYEPDLTARQVSYVLGVSLLSVQRNAKRIDADAIPGDGIIAGYQLPIGRREWMFEAREVRRLIALAGNPAAMIERLNEVLEGAHK